ncbi:ketopantoate reductase family protein [Streptomyces sp. NPDC050529]|uniref:ketopantoate reductase family protein n=1 Tax=unclassified Streptomyces TaxID=2593676 RepID=UPI002DD8FE93|nr:ketopantoate reductase family protein [Streptomyces sp. NBC_01022]WRZ85748.1 ketopantoate reductase family protein [Streptomyces sp. NBC_01022]
MKILVVGAGATGGYFGARLAQAGKDVTFLVRPRRAAALRERGLRITGLGEEETLTPRLVTADRLTDAYDLVLLSVKATALDGALDDIAPAVGPGTAIVPLLNGMAHLARLNDRFGEKAVLGGVAKVITTLNAEGDIVRLAPVASLTIGEQQGGTSPRVEAIAAVLADAGIDTYRPKDILTAMWSKWVFISALAGLTCLMRGTVGDVRAVPGGQGFVTALLAECAAVAAAAGHPVREKELDAVAETLTTEGSPLTASLYRDVAQGAPTEVEQVFGDLVDRARLLSVDTPLLDLVTLNLRVHEHRTAFAV